MLDPELRVDVVGHAALRVCHEGSTILTDPWLIDPIGFSSGFHFPPLVHDVDRLASETSAIYISHIHPDHFCPRTLSHFRKEIPIYIGEYRRKEFRDQVAALGFPVVEVPFQAPVQIPGTGFEVTLIEHDYEENAAYDSAIVIRTPELTLFENNDCFLHPDKYQWVRDHFVLDYAFLGYSPASFFPICFEMDRAEKERLLHESAERRYRDFVEAALILQARLTVPFASGARFLNAKALWKNVSFNSMVEACRRGLAHGLACEVMGPGDRILADGTVHRVCPVLEKDAELAEIERYAMQVQDWVQATQKEEPVARPDVVERFRDYLLDRWNETEGRLPGVRQSVIAYVLTGEEEQRFYFDFSRPRDQIFHWGEPEHYDMRYTYPAGGLQARLDGELDWDELHFTNEVSVHQVKYAKEFYMMLRSETLDLD